MIDNAIITVYLLGILALGVWSGRKVRSVEQFSVAGRSFGPWIIFATLSASFIGGGFSTGNAEKCFTFGVVNIFALWGFSLKEILVARFIAPRMDRYPNAISVGDIMERHYGVIGQVVTGIMSVIVCAGILGAQVGAIGIIFNVFLGIKIIYGIIIGCVIVIAYSTVGGMRAVVFTDIVQFVVLCIGIPVTLLFGIYEVGGLAALKAAVPPDRFTFLGSQKTLLQFVVLFLSFLLGETLVPPYVQRLFLSKDPKHTIKGTFWSGLLSIPFFAITGMIGIVALALKADLDPNLAMPYVIKTVLPLGLRGIVVAGIISIVMSSADSFLNAASVAVTHDIMRPLARGRLTKRAELATVRLSTVVVGVGSIIFAVKIKSIIDILLYSYNFWSPVVLVPLAAAIMGMKAGVKHFVAGAIGGTAGVLLWKLWLKDPFGIDGLIVGILCNGVVFALAYMIMPGRKQAVSARTP